MKLNAILIALFATAAYAQDGRPSKEQMMALKEEMRNAKTDEERMAIKDKIKMGLRPDPRMRGDFGGKDMGRMPPRPEDRVGLKGDGRPSKAQMMALKEELRNAKTDEERMAIREKAGRLRGDNRGKFNGKDMGRMPRRPEDRDAIRAETREFMESIKGVTDIEERKKLASEHKQRMVEKYQMH